jgi:predicted ABC-type ATPase
VFAGPNGSGKTTIINKFPKKIPLGIYINADDLEKKLIETKSIDLKKYGIVSSTKEIQLFIKQFGVSPFKLKSKVIYKRFSIRRNKLYAHIKPMNSYVAADIAEFIRQKLISIGKSFSFETVFSHPGKLELLKRAKEAGYRVYLYYVATDTPEININRVNIRVAKKGHPVDKETIRSRYYRSLEILFDAIKISNRAYLFDNSGKYYELVAEVTDGKNVNMLNKDIPGWFLKYVYRKIKRRK